MAVSPTDRQLSPLPASPPVPRPALPVVEPATAAAPVQVRRRPVSRACDRCRRRKAKCDYLNPVETCTLCRDAHVRCTFDMPLARRGPKAKKRSPSDAPGSESVASGDPVPVVAASLPAKVYGADAAPLSVSDPGSEACLVFASPSSSVATPLGPPLAARSTTDHTLSPQTTHRVSISQSGRAAAVLQRWYQLSTSPALRNTSLERMVNRCFDLFFLYIYPLTPLVHEPSLREGLSFFLKHSQSHINGSSPTITNITEPWSNFSHGTLAGGAQPEHWPETAFTLITAVCAEASFMLPKDIFPEGESVSDMFLQASRSCLSSYLEIDLDKPNANSITIRYFHSNCIHAAGKPRYSWHIFGEATRMAQLMGLHEESALEGLYPIEAELRRRTFYIVSMGDKSAAILNNRPITIHKYSFQNGITTSYPTGVESDASIGPLPRGTSDAADISHTRLIDGFNANLRLWQAAADILLEIRLLEDRRQFEIGHNPHAKFVLNDAERQHLDTLYVRFITCLDGLPPYLQSYTYASMSSTARETTQSNQFIIQCANLQVSFHCLRMVITQKFEEIAYFAPGVEQEDLRKTEIVRDMLRVMHEAPFWALQVNGEPYVEKIRLIGASLLAIIHRNGESPLGMRARGDFSVLLDILTRLDSKASDALRSDSSWTG